MRCLVLGGTGFLGGAITDALAHAGHEVTVLSRGLTPRALPKGTATITAEQYIVWEGPPLASTRPEIVHCAEEDFYGLHLFMHLALPASVSMQSQPSTERQP